MPERVIIDTDPGIDDALALLLALRSPELAVAAITTVSGNVPVDVATRNVFTIFSLVSSHSRPPVARGASRPRRKEPVYANHVHGDDGLGGLRRFRDAGGNPRYPSPTLSLSGRGAVDEILHQLSISKEPLTIIALGPLTNIAAAIEKHGERMAGIKEIVLMGGAVGVSGNITPAAEFNIYVDPHAAKVVFQSGIPLTVVGLDVTTRVKLTREHIEAALISRHTILGQFLSDSTRDLLAFSEGRLGEASFYLHDPLAVGVVIDPSFVTKQSMSVEIETKGEWTEGMTVADRRPLKPSLKKPPNAEVCLDVDSSRFVSFFLERLLGPGLIIS